MSFATRLAGVTATAAIAVAGAFGATAYADEAPTTEPCASQQAKVDKAEAALERVTAVFARQQERVAKAKEVKTEASAGQEKAAAKKALAKARQAKKEAKVTKRAQKMRLAKATERLETCMAEAEAEAASA